MSKQVTFYTLNTNPTKSNLGLNPVEELACSLVADAWRLGNKILLSCNTEEQAFRIDEALWQRNAEQFVPHNLASEIANHFTPIEICWVGKRSMQQRNLLISLLDEVPNYATSFKQIIDFVPVEEQLKQQARERYKHYRQLGFNMLTESAPSF